MVNSIYIKNKLIVSSLKEGRFNYLINEDGDKIPSSSFSSFEIKCIECQKRVSLKVFRKRDFMDKEYLCFSCNNLGERNGFYGKRHSKDSLEKQSSVKKGVYKGSKNPFYEKKHSKETKLVISEKIKPLVKGELNPFFGKEHSEKSKIKIGKSQKKYFYSLSEEEKEIRINLAREGILNFQKNNPEKTKSIRRKAALASIRSQRRFQMNSIEKLVYEKLLKISSDFEYSVILGFKQFDFGLKKEKILLEVHGDYWHGNPEIYKEEELNHIQLKKKQQDKEKYLFALNNEFKIYYIWETEILNNNFSILEEIEKEIKNVKV